MKNLTVLNFKLIESENHHHVHFDCHHINNKKIFNKIYLLNFHRITKVVEIIRKHNLQVQVRLVKKEYGKNLKWTKYLHFFVTIIF